MPNECLLLLPSGVVAHYSSRLTVFTYGCENAYRKMVILLNLKKKYVHGPLPTPVRRFYEFLNHQVGRNDLMKVTIVSDIVVMFKALAICMRVCICACMCVLGKVRRLLNSVIYSEPKCLLHFTAAFHCSNRPPPAVSHLCASCSTVEICWNVANIVGLWNFAMKSKWSFIIFKEFYYR